ncbi:MAG: hypothetical protein ACFE9R_18710 [Candidatus Hermodarchaeota archaeon]
MAIELTWIGWLSGITALGVFVFSIFFGLFALYKSKKFKSNLLIYIGLVYIFAALVYTGDVLDFFTILITGTNMDNSTGIIGLINWIWFPGAVFFAMVFGAYLLTPKKKWYIIIVYLILAVGFEFFLITDLSGSVTYTVPVPLGSDLINDNLVLESFASIIAFIFMGSALVFLGFGFLRKGIQSTGIIKKKFLILSLAAFMYALGGILDGLFEPNFTLIFIRAAMAVSAVLFYYGTKA